MDYLRRCGAALVPGIGESGPQPMHAGSTLEVAESEPQREAYRRWEDVEIDSPSLAHYNISRLAFNLGRSRHGRFPIKVCSFSSASAKISNEACLERRS